jgi:hypothetical protein
MTGMQANEFMIYLLKVNVCLVVCYLFYYFFLKKLTLFCLNRFFFLASIALSFIIPLHKIHPEELNVLGDYTPIVRSVQVTSQAVKTLITTERPSASVSDSVLNGELLFVCFIIGCCAAFIRLLVLFFSVVRMHRNSHLIATHPLKIYVCRSTFAPFSFGRSIYLPGENIDAAIADQILLHESTHVRQLHSIDVITSELLCCINWFNPVAFLFKKSIRLNLEYIADEGVISSGKDKRSYQYLLVHSLKSDYFKLTLAFNLDPLKNRLIMMNTKRSSVASGLRALLFLPLFFLLCISFTDTSPSLINTLKSISPSKQRLVSVSESAHAKRDLITHAPRLKETSPQQIKSTPEKLTDDATRDSVDLDHTYIGNGIPGKKQIAVPSFTRLSVKGIFQLRLIEAEEEKVVICADENLLDLFQVNSSGEELSVTTPMAHVDISSRNQQTVTIYYKSLSRLALLLIGKAELLNPLRAKTLEIISDCSEGTLLTLFAKSVKLRQLSNDPLLLSGSIDNLELQAEGPGNIIAKNLKVSKMQVEKHHLFTLIEVNVSDQLLTTGVSKRNILNHGAAPLQ